VLNTIYTPALLKELDAVLLKAEQRAQSSAETDHVALERKMFDYLRDYAALEEAKRQCRFLQAATLAQGLTNRQAELNRISPFLGYEPYAVYGPDWEAKRCASSQTKPVAQPASLSPCCPKRPAPAPTPLTTDDSNAGRTPRSMIPAGNCSLRPGAGRIKVTPTPRVGPIAA